MNMIARIIISLIGLHLLGCSSQENLSREGTYSGEFSYGNYKDSISFEIERDTAGWQVYFSSPAQNANRIPFRDIRVEAESIRFRLQSDFYSYEFSNSWKDGNTRLEGILRVDTVSVPYILHREIEGTNEEPRQENASFTSADLTLYGTLWHPVNSVGDQGLVLITSSGNTDRSASSAEARYFALRGYTVFHYDKRGTGDSEGDWISASMEELLADDISAIEFFAARTGIALSSIGILGSSQGGAKVPFILNELKDLSLGVSVSCPGSTLLESDLNYWTNQIREGMASDELSEARQLQRMVYEYISGEKSREALETALAEGRSSPWFSRIWVPDLNEVVTDRKLLYSPIPQFERLTQPVLIIQGSRDEIIPPDSYLIIESALERAGNEACKTVLLQGASHGMYDVSESDFPYWSTLHSGYLQTVEAWLNLTLDNP